MYYDIRSKCKIKTTQAFQQGADKNDRLYKQSYRKLTEVGRSEELAASARDSKLKKSYLQSSDSYKTKYVLCYFLDKINKIAEKYIFVFLLVWER